MHMTRLALCLVLIAIRLKLVLSCGCFTSTNCARDCADIQDLGFNTSGVYLIYPGGIRDGLTVFCDMETDGGGWLVIQRRDDGLKNFTQRWNRYQFGFGDVSGEHWLGNIYLNMITSQSVYKLRVDMEDWNGTRGFAKYKLFRVGDISTKYSIDIEGYNGNVENAMYMHNGKPFSTYDRDHSQKKCAALYQSGWWYNDLDCVRANLNGIHFVNGEATKVRMGLIWKNWKGLLYSIKRTEMKIRRI